MILKALYADFTLQFNWWHRLHLTKQEKHFSLEIKLLPYSQEGNSKLTTIFIHSPIQ